MAIEPFLTYNPNTGLIVKTKSEILQTLIQIAKSAYGDSYIVDEGTEMYTFLDILASGLADAGNAALDMYNSTSFIYATGAPLDSLCSLAGVIRQDGETDSQLRARYYKFLYSKSVGTVEALEAKLLEYSVTDDGNNTLYPIKNVKVYENYTEQEQSSDTIATNSTGAYKIAAHSILVILHLTDIDTKDGKVKYMLTKNDINNINEIITDYKSLGCGLTTDTILTDKESNTTYFATTNNANLELTLNIYFYSDSDAKNHGNAVTQHLYNGIKQYLSDLKLGEDIQYSGIMSCVYSAYSALSVNDYIFSVGFNSEQIGVGDEITYEGEYIYSPDTKSGTKQLNVKYPNIIIPYTTYIDSETTQITINIWSPSKCGSSSIINNNK